MRFSYGSTRWVLLIGDYAVKFARFQPIRIFKRFFHWRIRGEVVSRLRDFNNSLPVAIFMYVFAGIIANIEEKRFYSKHPSLALAPTLFSFFGIVNIQRRGVPIKENELSFCPFRQCVIPGLKYQDLDFAKHFARIEGRICLVDYGNVEVNKAIIGERKIVLAVPVPVLVKARSQL